MPKIFFSQPGQQNCLVMCVYIKGLFGSPSEQRCRLRRAAPSGKEYARQSFTFINIIQPQGLGFLAPPKANLNPFAVLVQLQTQLKHLALELQRYAMNFLGYFLQWLWTFRCVVPTLDFPSQNIFENSGEDP